MDSTPRLMRVIAAANQHEPKNERKMANMRTKGKTYLVETAQANDSCAARAQGEVYSDVEPGDYLALQSSELLRAATLIDEFFTISLPRACQRNRSWSFRRCIACR